MNFTDGSQPAELQPSKAIFSPASGRSIRVNQIVPKQTAKMSGEPGRKPFVPVQVQDVSRYSAEGSREWDSALSSLASENGKLDRNSASFSSTSNYFPSVAKHPTDAPRMSSGSSRPPSIESALNNDEV